MFKTKQDYLKNNDIIAYKSLSYFSAIAIIDIDDSVVWYYQSDNKQKIESIDDINISEIYYYDNNIECTCDHNKEEDENCYCEQSQLFFYDIDDDQYKESDKSNYSKIYLNECMKVRY